jgi:hypothetical protein
VPVGSRLLLHCEFFRLSSVGHLRTGILSGRPGGGAVMLMHPLVRYLRFSADRREERKSPSWLSFGMGLSFQT